MDSKSLQERAGSMNQQRTEEVVELLETSQSPSLAEGDIVHGNPSMELDSDGTDDSNDDDSSNSGSPNRAPRIFGDICEFLMPQKWVQDYGGICMADFDDARGRLAFATGSGKILMVELV
jgi:hypothetical protein